MDPARSVLWSIGAYLRRRAPVHAVPDFAAKKKPRASGGSYGASSALRAGGQQTPGRVNTGPSLHRVFALHHDVL